MLFLYNNNLFITAPFILQYKIDNHYFKDTNNFYNKLNMKKTFLFALVLTVLNSYAQQKASNQKQRLAQYIGNWASTDKITDDKPSLQPNIKMTVTPLMDSSSLQIQVFQKNGAAYKLLLIELISYDAVTDQIIAAGQNNAGQCFVGKGFFYTNNQWVMEDHDHNGKLTQTVTFNFMGSNAVALKGDMPGTEGWKVKYIKVKRK
jgi:hypothetical protein